MMLYEFPSLNYFHTKAHQKSVYLQLFQKKENIYCLDFANGTVDVESSEQRDGWLLQKCFWET